ncbi:MAG: HAMP domain-containing histidine kinase [Firmicutes bacterium]|nr:HAMP domain-containing histidine kinase [Bacillota bacterium]MCM1401963.1 HAMP domain-containing histidine kinase [Bacteroides sp.]MCM1477807.1 HAMP domain-containing histidine kinase [Bacteroides sp.]
MKKSIIWFLTIIMAVAFAGLLYVQIVYMHNMVKMRNEQFSEGVKRSLYAVSTALEQEETKYFLEADVAQIQTSVLPRYSTPGENQTGVKYSFTTNEGLTGDITLKGDADKIGPRLTGSRSSLRDVIKGQYMYQRSLLDEVILNIISQSSNRPIEERADSALVASLLAIEFANNGLNLPFEFAVINRMGAPVYESKGFESEKTGDTNMFVQTLFPNDSKNRMNYIKVYFPDKRDYIYHSVKFMIPSMIFTFILLIAFLYTIIVAFRQKKLTEMKNDFINNMTHEFKTPISTISLAAQMLNDNSVRKSPKMLEHISSVINDETKRLRFQVEKVLQMSMFNDSQNPTLRLQEVDANVAIANIQHTFKLKVEKYGGSIETELNAENAMVNVDEMHFTNVVFNLLDNAVKYRDEERPLKLKISTRDLSSSRLQIVVSDNGIGIRKDDLKKVFDKFYRVSTGNRHDVKGFGLGLAYVHKMVKAFGGEITVESEFKKGTKFIVILPLTKN